MHYSNLLMSKRQVRSPSCLENPSPKRNRLKSQEKSEMSSGKDSEDQVSLRIIMDKLTSIESRMEDNFSQIHSLISELRCEFKVQIDGVKVNIKEIEKSLENAWAEIEDVQQEAKTNKDSKRSHQDMLDKHTSTIQELQAEIEQIRADNNQMRPSLKETQEKLIALENYTRKENLRITNIPEAREENCWDIVYDIIENELKLSTENIKFHAVHRVGKTASQTDQDNSTPPRPRPIIARFVSREHTEQVLSVKNRLKRSERYENAYITKDYARAIQEERRSLIKAMFVAKEKGREAKVINRSLFIDNQMYDINSIPAEFKPVVD